MGYIERTIERFWSNVDTDADCWLWLGTTFRNGYGRFNYRDRSIGAHRFAYMVTHGVELGSDQYVCHHCDIPSCVNPDHLFLGSAADNTNDMMNKGRWRGNPDLPVFNGVANHSSKLTPDKVRTMRRLRDDGWEYRPIAAKFGVTPRAAWLAIQRRTWAHVD